MSSLGTERTLQTTNATAQTYNIGTLAAVGASIRFRVVLTGTKTDATKAFDAEWIGHAARNAIGNGLRLTAILVATGYTNAAAVPYTTPGVPAGWAGNIALAGNIVQVQWNGAAGDTVNWYVDVIERILLNGATL